MRVVAGILCGLGWLLLASAAGAVTITYQEGELLPSGASYSGTQDTMVAEPFPSTGYGADAILRVDLQWGNGPNREVQSLLRFEDIFGGGPDQILMGSTINSATVTLTLGGLSPGTLSLHRMLAIWDESSTWNSLGGGVTADDVEAVSVADATVVDIDDTSLVIDVTASLQVWVDNPSANLGWVLLIDSINGITWASSEGTVPAPLTVDFIPIPEPGTAALTGLGLALIACGRRRA
jgi:hypothetical protein